MTCHDTTRPFLSEVLERFLDSYKEGQASKESHKLIRGYTAIIVRQLKLEIEDVP